MQTKWKTFAAAAALCALLAGCSRSTGELDLPAATAAPSATQSAGANASLLPEKLVLVGGVPTLRVYVAQSQSYQEMDIERYVEGVLAGEMRNDWPMEALKAQAILARTFTLKFVSEKESKYPDADISTDISEAQAYNESAVNDRIRRAVEETRGMVIAGEGELPYAWFHAHSGGKTELAKVGLEWADDEPAYTQITEGMESDKAPTTVKHWTARFSTREVGEACAKTGVETGAVESISIGEKGESGRAVTLLVNGMAVSAPSLRLQLDSTRFKSTMLSEVLVEDGEVIFRGSGYGHGVGMSQWGAYAMAEQGSTAEEIVSHYFQNVELVSLWE
ncbi:MAG: SpoIID/LytB domain-containing protein [Eubacteriales bacterium]|nr:SpoIID/LytB domain-containing protein [Eubacteriales bacterium]